MLPAFLLGLALLFAIVLGLRVLTSMPPAAIVRGLRWSGLAVAGLALVFLTLTGRLAWVFAALAGLVPWLLRAAQLHNVWNQFQSARNRSRGAKAKPGNVSEVETDFLHMSLDHDSGEMDGRVLKGALRDRVLSSLSQTEMYALWHEVQADPPSVQVLEGWLDRVHEDWREVFDSLAGSRRRRGQPESGAMSRDEAYRLLGLAPGAGIDEIKAAHRKLMKKAHPDHGGSAKRAAQLNHARDLLIGA